MAFLRPYLHSLCQAQGVEGATWVGGVTSACSQVSYQLTANETAANLTTETLQLMPLPRGTSRERKISAVAPQQQRVSRKASLLWHAHFS